MTANESTPNYEENVTDGIDYERLGRETATAELERRAERVRDRLHDAAGKIDSDELTQEDVAEIQKELANTQVWLARVAEGRHLDANDVLVSD
jgi:frataxin-like iron-binding protein CyaY